MRDWDAFEHLTPLRRELEQFTSRFLSGPDLSNRDSFWAPPVDIYERDDALVLVVDLPGLSREDIDLHVEADALTLQGTRPRPDAGDTIRQERPSGRFRRSFRIGLPVDADNARASYRHGVLEIIVPKTAPRKPAPVPIESE